MDGPFAGWFAAYVFAVALCIGSFLNVVIARVPAGKSLVRPGSACPRCGSPIRWYDNVPVVSWILLRGRCRSCALPISPRYPVVELVTAVLVVAIVRHFGPTWTAAGYAVFACALVALTFIDLDTWLLPHEITWPLLAAGLASPIWNSALRPLDSVIGAAAGFAFFAAIALFGEKVLRRETMGWGDVWLLSGIGAWLGWQQLLPVVLLAALQGSVAGILMIWLKRGASGVGSAPRAPGPEGRTTAVASTGPDAGAHPGPAPGQTGDRNGTDATGSPDASAPPRPEAAGNVAERDLAIIPPPPVAAAVDDDWVPPPHAVPFGPFLALAAIEQLLLGAAIERGYSDFLVRLWR